MSDFRMKLEAMNIEQLMQINKAVVEVIRNKRANDTFNKARQFYIGQTVQFQSKQGRAVKMVVDRINTKSISGREVGGFGNWRVHPSLLSAAS